MYSSDYKKLLDFLHMITQRLSSDHHYLSWKEVLITAHQGTYATTLKTPVTETTTRIVVAAHCLI